jgi:hypothetical protein
MIVISQGKINQIQTNPITVKTNSEAATMILPTLEATKGNFWK